MLALENDGAPVVRAFRTDEGQLTFRYLTCRAGGMSVWAPISEEIMRGVREDSPELDRQLRAAALGLARSIMQSESEAIERVPQLEQLVDSQAAELEQAGRREEALRRRIEELEARESGATSPAPIAEASAPDAPRRRRQQTRKAA